MPFQRRTTRLVDRAGFEPTLFACRASFVERREPGAARGAAENCSRPSREATMTFVFFLIGKVPHLQQRPVGVERTGLEPVIFACRASTVGRET